MKTHLVIIVVVLMVGLATPIVSPSSRWRGITFTLRIDDDCRVWWNMRRAAPANLPRLLPSDTMSPESDEYVLDIPALHELFTVLLAQRERRQYRILITPHPNSHYVCTDNVLAILDRLEDEFNGLKARELNKPIDSLVGGERFRLQYGFYLWYDRDDKVMEATHAARGFTDSIESVVSEKNTFEFQYEAGYWSGRQEDMLELYPPRVTKPKRGIPRPVEDEDSLQESLLLKYVKP